MLTYKLIQNIMKKNIPYKVFDNYIIRTPILPFKIFENLTAENSISDIQFNEISNNKIILEAIFISSPQFYNELLKWKTNQNKNKEVNEKTKYTLLKYISRMSSRCTPFGLFAGCSLGKFDSETEIVLQQADFNNRHSRLDMDYLVSLSQELAKNEKIKKQLLFYPNSSIYNIQDKIRFIQYQYINGKRINHIVAVNTNRIISKAIVKAKKGISIHNLVEALSIPGFKKEEIYLFVEKLIENQILINELEPKVTGAEFLNQIIDTLKTKKNIDDIIILLEEINTKTNALDTTMSNEIEKYEQIKKSIISTHINFDEKCLFQTDLIIKPLKNTLSKKNIPTIFKALSFLNKITIASDYYTLTDFKNNFTERYEEREVSLSKALDIENGIGYSQNKNSTGLNPLIDDLNLSSNYENEILKIELNKIENIFKDILSVSYKKEEYSIKLNDSYFHDLNENWNDLPATFSAMIEIIIIDGVQKIKFANCGGSSAANLLARFAYGDTQINNFIKQIIKKEETLNKSKILAEIVHLPESKVGNVLLRPSFRKYEVPYLAMASVPQKNIIPIDDLFLSVRNNKIYLRSKIKNKEILPRLSSAHNYFNNALPIYNFLGDLQNQGTRPTLSLDLEQLTDFYSFIPRIEYDDIIFCEAMWNLKNKDLKLLYNTIKSDEQLMESVNQFRKERMIPKFVTLSENDNQLLINLENLTSIKMFLNTVKNKKQFKLLEFLHSEDGIVKNAEPNEFYTNQFILSFYKE